MLSHEHFLPLVVCCGGWRASIFVVIWWLWSLNHCYQPDWALGSAQSSQVNNLWCKNFSRPLPYVASIFLSGARQIFQGSYSCMPDPTILADFGALFEALKYLSHTIRTGQRGNGNSHVHYEWSHWPFHHMQLARQHEHYYIFHFLKPKTCQRTI